jgi:hypothetical protein
VQLAATLNQVFGLVGSRILTQPQVIGVQQGRGGGPGGAAGPGGGNQLQPNQIERAQLQAEQQAQARQALAAAQQGFTLFTQATAGTTGEVRVVPEESTNSLIIRTSASDWEAERDGEPRGGGA